MVVPGAASNGSDDPSTLIYIGLAKISVEKQLEAAVSVVITPMG